MDGWMLCCAVLSYRRICVFSHPRSSFRWCCWLTVFRCSANHGVSLPLPFVARNLFCNAAVFNSSITSSSRMHRCAVDAGGTTPSWEFLFYFLVRCQLQLRVGVRGGERLVCLSFAQQLRNGSLQSPLLRMQFAGARPRRAPSPCATVGSHELRFSSSWWCHSHRASAAAQVSSARSSRYSCRLPNVSQCSPICSLH
ncbi:hypothetical protein M3J09_001738 [Ascochyta lentis]